MPFMSGKQRPAPVRDQLLHLLRQYEKTGLTTVEIAVRTGRTIQTVNSTLCKMRQYGFVEKEQGKNYVKRPHELNRWKLRERR